jgi:hypothetical protein
MFIGTGECCRRRSLSLVVRPPSLLDAFRVSVVVLHPLHLGSPVSQVVLCAESPYKHSECNKEDRQSKINGVISGRRVLKQTS